MSAMFVSLRRRPAALFLAMVVLALVAAACGGSSGDGLAAGDPAPQADDDTPLPQQVVDPLAFSGPARSYALGFAAIPGALSEDAYVRVFDDAAQHGDMIMIQRAVPWSELAPGAALSAQTEATIERERSLIAERGLDLLFAIDPWQPTNRGLLAGDPPGDGFTDGAVVDAYVAFAELVVQRYQPRWLVLAVDLDQIAAARPSQLDAFEEAYVRAYNRVKELAPQTRVFATFQLEDVQSLLPWGQPHPPQFSLIPRFQPFLDVLAVSSFPSFIFPFARDIPDEYYARLLSFGLPLALVPVGFATQPGRGGITFGTRTGQRSFLERLLAEADAADWELIVWLAPQDPRFASQPPYDLIGRMGLRDADGQPKLAWDLWVDDARRPWVPLPASPPPSDDAQSQAQSQSAPGAAPNPGDNSGGSPNNAD